MTSWKATEMVAVLSAGSATPGATVVLGSLLLFLGSLFEFATEKEGIDGDKETRRSKNSK